MCKLYCDVLIHMWNVDIGEKGYFSKRENYLERDSVYVIIEQYHYEQ